MPNEFIDKVICGDNVELIKKLPSNSIDAVITSPPYDDIRQTATGYSSSFKLEELIKQLYRVLKEGGVVVWVVGDAVQNGSETLTSFKQAIKFQELGFNVHDTMIYEKNSSSFPARATGNRYSQMFEYMFVFSKGKPKTANLICDKQNRWAGWAGWGGNGTQRDKNGKLKKVKLKPVPEFSPRGNIWKYDTGAGYSYSTSDKEIKSHPAIFPERLVYDHLLTWTNEKDIVLDPFMGSGTTGRVCDSLNRHYIGFEFNSTYVKMADKRIKKNHSKPIVIRESKQFAIMQKCPHCAKSIEIGGKKK